MLGCKSMEKALYLQMTASLDLEDSWGFSCEEDAN